MLYYERKYKREGFALIIGTDEAGRGPLAGPVVAAAVALGSFRFKNRIDDSKKLSARQREMAFGEILGKSVFGIGIVSEKTVDRLNILEATRMAMEEAIASLVSKCTRLKSEKICVLADGNVPIAVPYRVVHIVKGDARSKSIASASILAKVTRDSIMALYDRLYPHYGFLRHKGYPTASHRQALQRFGPSVIHRMSFCGV